MTDMDDLFSDLDESDAMANRDPSDTQDTEDPMDPGDADDVDDPRDEPAFMFEDIDQHTIYVLPEQWSEYKRFKHDVKGELLMQDIEDVYEREIDTAVFEFVSSHSEEIADLVVKARTDD